MEIETDIASLYRDLRYTAVVVEQIYPVETLFWIVKIRVFVRGNEQMDARFLSKATALNRRVYAVDSIQRRGQLAVSGEIRIQHRR